MYVGCFFNVERHYHCMATPQFLKEDWDSDWRYTRDVVAFAITILLANVPTLFAFYVILDTYNSTSGVGIVHYLTTTMSGAVIFAVLWTGIVFFAYGPSLSRRWNGR